MSAEQYPSSAPATLTGSGKSYAFGQGERNTEEWVGERSVLEAKFAAMKNDTFLSSLELSGSRGSYKLIASYGINAAVSPIGDPENAVEELYAITMTVGVALHPYFDDLSPAERAAAVNAADNQDVTSPPAGWSAKQKLIFQLIREGQDQAYITSFALRRQSLTTKDVRLENLFQGINTVVDLPRLSNHMTQVLQSLPSGEWLKLPATATYQGRGLWQIGEEWQWSTKWSVVYGGTDARGVEGL